MSKEKWEVRKLGEVLVRTEQMNPSQEPEKEFTYIDVSSVNNETKNIETTKLVLGKDAPSRARKVVKTNDVIYATIRPTLNRVTIIPEKYNKAVCSTAYFVLRGKESIDNKYLFYFLITDEFNKKMKKSQKGASYPAVGERDIRKVLIRYPKSLSEQQRIVSLLDETLEALDKAKANAEKNLENAKELFESYLEDVFKNKGEDWEEKELGDLGKVSMCRRIFKNQTTPVGDIPFYKIGTFGREPDAFISKELYDEYVNVSSFPKKGDVMISASGTIGRRVVYDGRPAYFQDSNIVWIDNDEELVLNEFLYHFYGICKWEGTQGATISRLYNKNLRETKIIFPKSKDRQLEIVKEIDALSAETKQLESHYQIKLNNLEELRKSVLEKAFNGEL